MDPPRRPPPPRVSFRHVNEVLTQHAQTSVGNSGALRLRRIEPFDEDARRLQSPVDPLIGDSRTALAEERRSLRSMPFSPTIPATQLLTTVLVPMPGIASTSSTRGKSDAAPPADFIASLRSKTLLDYECMRQFSLLKRKPMPERNLSRMSASSLYSVRTAHLELEKQAQRLHRLPNDTAGSGKDDGDTRAASEVSAPNPSTSARTKRPLFRKLHAALPSPSHVPDPGADAGESSASACFHTLWSPSEAATATLDSTQKNRQLSIYLKSPLTSQEDRKLLVGQRRTIKEKAPPRLSRPIMSDGLSDFDLRKCHQTSLVTAQHGFLLEQDLAALLVETGYDRTELYALWARFKALCAIAKSPKGIDKETFRRGIPQLSVEDEFFIDRVFDILDADGSGILEWQEFVEALSALEKGDTVKRVCFLFRVYDLNGNGTSIHRDEVMRFLLSSLLVQTTEELVEVAKHFAEKIFEAVGCGDKDMMKVGDALRYMKEHPTADIYSLFGRTMVSKQRSSKLDVSKWKESTDILTVEVSRNS